MKLAGYVLDKASGVWVRPDAKDDFAYSDGQELESYILDAVRSAQDLSVDSAELASKIKAWPDPFWASEYHLSAKRANLLRWLPLPKDAQVLELGCGCGAITRILGELGAKVIAVEGLLFSYITNL